MNDAPAPYLHQVRSHHAPGSHHVQQGSVLVPDQPQHGLAQTEEVKSAAPVQRGLGLPCRKSLIRLYSISNVSLNVLESNQLLRSRLCSANSR